MVLFRRIVALVTAVALVVTQTTAVAQEAADPQRGVAADAETFGRSIMPDPSDLFSAPDGGDATLLPHSSAPVTIAPSSLFPGAVGGTVPDLRALFGEEHGSREQGTTRAGELQTEPSPEGEAYRTVLDSRLKIGPDLRDDPFFDTTEDVLETIKTLGTEYSSCTETSVFEPGTVTGHVPDLKRCERLALPPGGTCDITHSLVLAQDRETEIFATQAYAQWPDEDFRYKIQDRPHDVTYVMDFAAGVATWTEYWLETYGKNDNIRVASRTVTRQISRIDINETCQGSASAESIGAFQVERGASTMSGSGGWISNVYAESEVRQVVPPSCGNGLKASFLVSGGDCRIEGSHDNEISRCYSVPVTVSLDRQKVVADLWAPQDCIDAASSAVTSICRPHFEVIEGPTDPSACSVVGGRSVCPGSEVYGKISSPPFDPEETVVGRLAQRVRVTTSCTLPEVVCYEDDNGNRECPAGPEAQEPIADGCTALRDNPSCSFMSTAVVEDALDDNGNPYIWEDTYDCGYGVSTGTVERKVGLMCPDAIRGVGTDLVTPAYETNENFAQVAATLEAANMMAMDADCTVDEATGVADCKVFSGTAHTCKKAVGGIVNCCESPAGVSLAQYLQLAFGVRELDAAIGHLDQASQLRGAWEFMTSPVNDAWSTLTEPMTSAFNSISGSSTAQATDAAAEGLLGSVEQALLQQAAEWTNALFGEAATNALFSAGEAAGPAVVNGAVQEGVQLGGGAAIVGSALSVVMLAYTIYSMTMLIIQIAWKCKKAEYEVAAKRELKACHYNGTYCASKALGFCIERRQSYCCFASPLSRIMQEQLRPLLGRGWGSAKNPDCGPIDVEDFARADWSRVDLSEWMSILIATDMMPNVTNITAETLTGAGRAIAAGIEPEVRLSTPERTIERFGDVIMDDWMEQAKQELIGATAPVVPAAPGPPPP